MGDLSSKHSPLDGAVGKDDVQRPAQRGEGQADKEGRLHLATHSLDVIQYVVSFSIVFRLHVPGVIQFTDMRSGRDAVVNGTAYGIAEGD